MHLTLIEYGFINPLRLMIEVQPELYKNKDYMVVFQRLIGTGKHIIRSRIMAKAQP